MRRSKSGRELRLAVTFARLLQHRRGSGCVLRKHEVGLLRNEFLRDSLHRLHVGCPANVEPDVAALRPPQLKGPKYAGSFRRGDFADFHQRFSLVPRRCAGKYPQKTPDTGLTSIRVASSRSCWTVLAAIKGDPELAGIPVVLMSIVDQKNRGYALGAADYLVKPVDRTKLVETLTSIRGSTSGCALLVDDDDVVRRSVRQALEPIGWQVTEAENGQVAVEAITAARPDVIILDLMMPKMDGFEFLDELRSRPNWRDIPIVVITAKDLTDEDRNRLNGGVERIIQKSDRDEMLRQLSREIGKCNKRQTPRIT